MKINHIIDIIKKYEQKKNYLEKVWEKTHKRLEDEGELDECLKEELTFSCGQFDGQISLIVQFLTDINKLEVK
jgi:hypothetical protein